MTVETNARYISGLNEVYPLPDDFISEGDDHIRLIKATLKGTFPGFNSAVTMTSAKLNQLDTLFTQQGTSYAVSSSLIFGTGKTLDMGGNRITNGAAPVDDSDFVTKGFLSTDDTNWPVGSIHFSVDSRNPSVTIGFGTWEAFGQGKVMIGAGTFTDSSGTVKTFAGGDTGGEYAHALTTGELASHVHGGGSLAAGSAGEHIHDIAFESGESDGSWNGSDLRARLLVEEYVAKTKPAGAHIHPITGDTGTAGQGTAHNNMQPFISVYIWKRTA